MNRIFTSLFVLISILSSQYANAQVTLSTDCSSQYLVKAYQEIDSKHNDYFSFTYNNDRQLTSFTQGADGESATADVIWTSTNIVYKYGGYDLITAFLDDNGNAKSITNINGESITYNYENGYLVSYSANTLAGNMSGQIKWKDGNLAEMKHCTNELAKTYAYEYSDIPNNTNLDFGIMIVGTTFPLPLGKGIKNLLKHADLYYESTLVESTNATYEFDSLNRPVKLISNGISYKDNKSKEFTKTVVVSYDESFVPLSIAKPVVESSDDSQTYNIMGQKVNGQQKGIVIRGGKKYVIK